MATQEIRHVKLAIVVAFGIFFVIAGVVYWFTTDAFPNAPSGVRCYRKTARVEVKPDNLANWKFQVTQFAKLKSGETIAPILRVIRPNFRGFMGGVRHDPIWEATFHFMGEGQANLDLPIDDEIVEHVVLVRYVPDREQLSNPWRVWTFNPPDISQTLVMPRFETMESLDNRQDARELLQKDQTAQVFAKELRK